MALQFAELGIAILCILCPVRRTGQFGELGLVILWILCPVRRTGPSTNLIKAVREFSAMQHTSCVLSMCKISQSTTRGTNMTSSSLWEPIWSTECSAHPASSMLINLPHSKSRPRICQLSVRMLWSNLAGIFNNTSNRLCDSTCLNLDNRATGFDGVGTTTAANPLTMSWSWPLSGGPGMCRISWNAYASWSIHRS